MIDGSEVLGLALVDFGETATVDGGPGTMNIIFNGPSRLVDAGSGETVVLPPTALATSSAIAAAGIEPGNNGTMLTIRTIDYTVLAVGDPDESGDVTMVLGAQP